MIRGAARAVRFWRTWANGGKRIRAVETDVVREEQALPATLYLPPGGTRNLPAWVLLHGITVPGRRHEVLVRFARALAGTGTAVLTPEVPEWSALRLEPERTLATIQASVQALSIRPEVDPDRLGLVGFSFGAPQALIACADPSLGDRLRVVVGFGGYCDLRRLLWFMFTGEHEWQGLQHHRRPDPYGRWVVGANYLTRIPRYRTYVQVAAALKDLATEAGQRRLASWDPAYDGVKGDLRAALPAAQRPLFDLFAPSAAQKPDPKQAAELVDDLFDAMQGSSSLLEPARYLADITPPVRLVHGVGDRLIPFTESLRLAERFGPHADVRVALTGFFSHSSSERGVGPWARARQAGALGLELARIFEAV